MQQVSPPPVSAALASSEPVTESLVTIEPAQSPRELTVVIPAFNEEGAIADVVRGILAKLGDLVAEVLVVDDGSRDATARLAAEAGARVISKRRNRGYGAALKTGIRACRTPYFITMDADGQHRAQDARALWARAKENHMVIGSRQALIHSALWRMPGKWVLNLIAQILVQQRIPDLNSGLRILHRETVLKYLHICPSGFSMSTTTTMAFLTRGYDVEFVPIEVNQRIGKSTVKLKTGWDTLILILRIATLFNPLRLFLPLSILAFVSGLAWGLPIVIAREGVSVGAMLAIVTGLLLFFLGLISDQISQLRLERFEDVDPLNAVEAQHSELPAGRQLTGE